MLLVVVVFGGVVDVIVVGVLFFGSERNSSHIYDHSEAR